MKRLSIPLLFAVTATLGGCAGMSSDYPSLKIRDAERVQGTFEPVPAQQAIEPAPAPADLPGRLASLGEQAQSAHADFMAAVPATEQAVAAAVGTNIDSNAWAAAQIALADLDAARSRVSLVLGDLDLLYVDATLDFTQRKAIGTARDGVVALVKQEDAALARLRSAIQKAAPATPAQ